MNLVGKIFIVLILVMSVFFCAMIVAVYATHTNWKNVATSLDENLKKVNQEVADLTQRNQKLTGDLETEKKAKSDAVAKLVTENTQLLRDRDQQEKALAQVEEERRRSVAAMEAAQETLANLRTETERLRKEVVDTEQAKQGYFRQMVILTDQMHQTADELTTLRSQTSNLAADHARLTEAMRKLGLDPERDYTDVPPKVEGLVTAVRGSELVEVSIGGDDGLLKGHHLEVYRAGNGSSTYLGRIEVTATEPDKAVARILPGFQRGAIQRGDNVATQLN